MPIRWFSADRMTRMTGRKHKVGQWIDHADFGPPEPSVAPMVISDIQPYRSAVTRETIQGRRQHREHLRAHGLIEVGNEKLSHKRIDPTPKGEIANDIKRAIAQGPAPDQARTLRRAQNAQVG